MVIFKYCVQFILKSGITENATYRIYFAFLELNGQHELFGPETRIQVGRRNFWMPASYNPGLHVRNRYGHAIYKHVQHWITLGITPRIIIIILHLLTFCKASIKNSFLQNCNDFVKFRDNRI